MNCIKDPAIWTSFYPENLTPPELLYEGAPEIRLPRDDYSLGKWICRLNVQGGKFYTVKATASTDASIQDAWVLVSTHKASGKMHVREHAENAIQGEGTIEFSHCFFAEDDVEYVKIELWLKGRDKTARWSTVELNEAPPVAPRSVTIASTYIDYRQIADKTLQGNLNAILTTIDNSAKYAPDIIALSEGVYHRGVCESLKAHSETDCGTVCNIIKDKAKEHSCYIIYNFHEKSGKEYFNTSILIDRNGEICGKYRKTHPTVTELERGISGGEDIPVFTTDFGRIGMLICWDQYFPATAELLAQKGAEIIFISTVGDASYKTQSRATDHGIYVVTSGVHNENPFGWKPSRIVSPAGTIIAQSEEHTGCAHCTIDLSKKDRVWWLSVGDARTDPKGCYIYQRNNNIK